MVLISRLISRDSAIENAINEKKKAMETVAHTPIVAHTPAASASGESDSSDGLDSDLD